MRICTNKLFPPYFISKYNTILTQDGKVFDTNMGGTHWAHDENYIVQSVESSTQATILQRSLVDTPVGPGYIGSISGYRFNWSSWSSNTVRYLNGRFYNGSNPLKTLDVTAVDGTGKVTAVAITDAIDIEGNTFATGGNMQSVPIKGGIVFANKMFFNLNNFGEDTGVRLAAIDIGARQDLWVPDAPLPQAAGLCTSGLRVSP